MEGPPSEPGVSRRGRVGFLGRFSFSGCGLLERDGGEECHAHVGVFEGSDIVGSISTHQSVVT